MNKTKIPYLTLLMLLSLSSCAVNRTYFLTSDEKYQSVWVEIKGDRATLTVLPVNSQIKNISTYHVEE